MTALVPTSISCSSPRFPLPQAFVPRNYTLYCASLDLAKHTHRTSFQPQPYIVLPDAFIAIRCGAAFRCRSSSAPTHKPLSQTSVTMASSDNSRLNVFHSPQLDPHHIVDNGFASSQRKVSSSSAGSNQGMKWHAQPANRRQTAYSSSSRNTEETTRSRGDARASNKPPRSLPRMLCCWIGMLQY